MISSAVACIHKHRTVLLLSWLSALHLFADSHVPSARVLQLMTHDTQKVLTHGAGAEQGTPRQPPRANASFVTIRHNDASWRFNKYLYLMEINIQNYLNI